MIRSWKEKNTQYNCTNLDFLGLRVRHLDDNSQWLRSQGHAELSVDHQGSLQDDVICIQEALRKERMGNIANTVEKRRGPYP